MRTPVVLVVILLGLAVASPLVTSWLNALPFDWKGMSDVGQAYGALSAALSAFALGGVVASLLMQRRQYRLSENHGIRERHLELIHMTFEDPSLKPCWGETSRGSGLTEKEAAYCNLILDHWHMLWQIERINTPELRRMARTFFKGEIGRRYWTAFGNPWMTPTDRQAEEFQEIFDEELKRAVSDGPPSVRRGIDDDGAERAAEKRAHDVVGSPPDESSKSGKGRFITAAIVGASAALIIDQAMRGRRVGRAADR